MNPYLAAQLRFLRVPCERKIRCQDGAHTFRVPHPNIVGRQSQLELDGRTVNHSAVGINSSSAHLPLEAGDLESCLGNVDHSIGIVQSDGRIHGVQVGIYNFDLPVQVRAPTIAL